MWDSVKWQCVNPFVTSSINKKITLDPSYDSLCGELKGNFEGTAKLNGDFTGTSNSTFNGFGSIPIGGIIMWSGVKSTIPDGWALCDGRRARDLGGRA